MLHAMNDTLAAVLRAYQPPELTVHDRSIKGYAASYAEAMVAPISGETMEIPITRDVEISRDEAIFLLRSGALWAGAGAAPRL